MQSARRYQYNGILFLCIYKHCLLPNYLFAVVLYLQYVTGYILSAFNLVLIDCTFNGLQLLLYVFCSALLYI